MKKALDIAKETFSGFMEDKCPRMAAALSYATIFALPPLLLVLLYLLGLFVDPDQFRGRIVAETAKLVGPDGANMISTIITQANRPGGGVMAVVGILMLLVGATGAFVQLQDALNTAWEVKPDPDAGGIKVFIGKRVMSFGMILAVGFLLLVSFVVAAAVSAMGDVARDYLGGAGEIVAQVGQFVVGLAITWLLFALIFKVLPDAKISWKDVRVGALVTALLFGIGRFAIGFYLGKSASLDAFGTAAALAVLLIWIYYAAMIVLLGAEFTQVWVRRHGREIQPEEGAVKFVKTAVAANRGYSEEKA